MPHLLQLDNAGISMPLVYIPRGEFLMGQIGKRDEEEPIHRVGFTEGFWMSATMVTQAQFSIWLSRIGIEHRYAFPENQNHPADCVSWKSAAAFCQWLTEEFSDSFPPGAYAAHLPIEAQWEYACRAGSDTNFYGGDGVEALECSGWYWSNADGTTHPVGEKAPNDFGLYDMHGNLLEWCGDVWDAKAYSKRFPDWETPGPWSAEDAGGDAEYATDRERSLGEPMRVVRGGSWISAADFCRSAFRAGGSPTAALPAYGFRVCFVGGGEPTTFDDSTVDLSAVSFSSESR